MHLLQDTHPRNLGLKDWAPPFLLGFIATSFQILLLREFCVHFYGNEITFGFVLAAWLLWGSIGSLTATKITLPARKMLRFYFGVTILFTVSLAGLRFSRFLMGILPGEVTGMLPALAASLLLSLLISFPLGMLFVFNVQLAEGNLSRVYLLESLGACAGGLSIHFLFIPFFSNWQSASIAGGLCSLLAFFFIGKSRPKLSLTLILIFLFGFSLADFPSQKIYWKPLRLVESKDTLYGKLHVIRTQEQVSLFDNSFHIYTYPNISASEEAVHFALLQNPEARTVLLVGGGAGGGIREVLKYPEAEVDYAELDPEIVRISLRFLPEEERKTLENPRVRMAFKDGKAFLQSASKKYDMIILNVPEPVTARVNRFYTREFFVLAKEKMNPDGVISFRVPSAENYISPELQQFLSSLYATLKDVFRHVEVIPGNTNVFLASESPLSTDLDFFSERIAQLNIETVYVSPSLLVSRLNPLRIDRLREKVETGDGKKNLDFTPISYFFTSILWSKQFKNVETRIMLFFFKLPSFWLLDFPVLLFVFSLVVLWLKRRQTSFLLLPLPLLGFTTIILEIVVVIMFQTLYGFVYGRISLLLAAFMLGLFLGSLLATRRKKKLFRQIILLQAGLLVLIFLLEISLNIRPPELFAHAFLLLLGILGGDMFVTANHLYIKRNKNYGLGYALDLGGSFLGAVATSAILIPLFGIPLLLKYLLILNSFGLLFLLLRPVPKEIGTLP